MLTEFLRCYIVMKLQSLRNTASKNAILVFLTSGIIKNLHFGSRQIPFDVIRKYDWFRLPNYKKIKLEKSLKDIHKWKNMCNIPCIDFVSVSSIDFVLFLW